LASAELVFEKEAAGRSPQQAERALIMPTIAWFYGIAIQMYYNDHEPPHFHARYGRARAKFRLSGGEIISGELVSQWALVRSAELQDNSRLSVCICRWKRSPTPCR